MGGVCAGLGWLPHPRVDLSGDSLEHLVSLLSGDQVCAEQAVPFPLSPPARPALAGVKTLAIPSVRERLRREWTAVADAQRGTVRCLTCGWYRKNLSVGEGKRAFAEHLTGARHTGRNRKSGPQAKTRDRLEGRSWAK